ncbi:MAG TPA: universal stress protein [Steroidobacteraceae bacterium]|nr:universal stress protein [Steroidobacteraceae bacterium]
MENNHRILFAIRNPTAKLQPGLAKAIQVARASGAKLELFHALDDPLFIELAQLDDNTVDRLRERVEEEVRIPLVRLCNVAQRHGVQAEASVAWDYPPHEAIVRRAVKIGAELIVAECHKGGRTRPWLIHLTDWELLRLSPVPVLLLKNAKAYRRPLTLAAVDPAHAHAKPSRLDARILAAAAQLSKGLRGTLHMVHANYPTIVGLGPPVNRTWSTLSYEELKDQERQAFEVFRANAAIPRTRAHLVEGNPSREIPRVAGKLGASIVVMGALSRSGLERVFIGNTAERVLGALNCDVLVVKPEGFVSQLERERRGMRVVASPTLATPAL